MTTTEKHFNRATRSYLKHRESACDGSPEYRRWWKRQMSRRARRVVDAAIVVVEMGE